MVTITRRRTLILPLGPTLGVVGGLIVALAALVIPASLLDRVPWVGDAASFATARIMTSLFAGCAVMALAGLALSLLFHGRTFDLVSVGGMFGRGDVHPDAPPRAPLFATRDLGTPFLDVKAPSASGFDPLDMMPIEQPLPHDLDMPLAAFDPGAILRDPLPASEVLAPLAALPAGDTGPRPALIDPGDRIETFELTRVRAAPEPAEPIRSRPAYAPATGAVPEPVVAPETEATVHDLLARLERGIARQPAARPHPAREAAVAQLPASSLVGTLGDLRRLATGSR